MEMEIIYGMVGTCLTGILAWMLIKVHQHDKQIQVGNKTSEIYYNTIIQQQNETKTAVKEMSARLDLFLKSEIDTMKELINRLK